MKTIGRATLSASVLGVLLFGGGCSEGNGDSAGGAAATSGTDVTSTVAGSTTTAAAQTVSSGMTSSSTGGGRARDHLLVETKAEGASWSDPWDIVDQAPDNGHALTQSSEQARVGASAIRFELHSTDPIVSSSVRTEMTLPESDDMESMNRWYGLSYYLVDWGSDEGGESILQWHDVDGTCPPLSIQIYDNQMQLTNCIDGANTYFPIGDVVSNEWIDIVIHVDWKIDATGTLELWRNDEQLVNQPNIRTQSSGGSYIKVGMNKWSWAPDGGSSTQTQRIFFIDELRIGDDQAEKYDVAPGDY